jgi:hypothetical protein
MLRYIRRLFHPKSTTFQRPEPRRSFMPSLELLEKREVLSTFHLRTPVGVGTLPQLAAVGHFRNDLFPQSPAAPFMAVSYQEYKDADGAVTGGGGVGLLAGDLNGNFQKVQDIEVAPMAEGIVVGHFTDSGHDDVAVASNGTDTVPGAVTLLRHDGYFGFTRG